MKRLFVIILSAIIIVGCGNERKIKLFFGEKSSDETNISSQLQDYTKGPSLKDPYRIWIFTLGQSKVAAQKIAQTNNYEFTEDEYGLKGSQVVDYIGIDWDSVDLAYSASEKNDISIYRIFFRRHKYHILNEHQKLSLVEKLDEIYGEHRLERETRYGLGEFWKWDNNRITVNFSCIDCYDLQELVFTKKYYNEPTITWKPCLIPDSK